MRTRTRTGLWDRKYGWTYYEFPSSYTSYKVGSLTYYPPWVGLAQTCESNAQVLTALDNIANATSETITDVGGPAQQDNRGIYAMNPVDHVKTSCGCAPYSAVGVRTASGSRRCEGGRYIPPPNSSVPATPQLTPAQILQMYGECYNALVPSLEADMSLANFIYELKEFKGLVKAFSRGMDVIKNVADHVSHSVEPAARPRKRRSESLSSYRFRLKEWSRNRRFYLEDTAASLDLNYSYAVRPFVKDVAVMSTMWGGLSDAIRKLNDQGSVRNVHHAFRNANHIGTVSGSGQVRTVTCTKNVYRLTAEMTYGLRPMSKLDAFMVWSGLRMNPKKLWDMLPFSFVLDHYFTMGEALGSLDRSEVTFDMARLMESVSSESMAASCLHPTYYAYSHFAGGGAGDATELFESTSYAAYKPLSWRMKRSYKRYLIDVPYVRPPVLPKLAMPTCGEIRKDLDLAYLLLYRGVPPDVSWRTG